MGSGVVTVGRQRYAVGLYWENSPGSGRVAQIAREAASQPGQQADFYAIRPGNKDGRVPQFGLAQGNEASLAAGMPVLSGCLSAQIPGSWAGAFRFTEGVALIVVRDDLIVPDGDIFFRDESEARDRLIQEIGFGGIQNIYAPEAWSIPGGDSVPLPLLLNENKNVRLQPVQLSTKVKLAALLGVLVLVLGIGLAFYFQQESDKQAATLSSQALQQARNFQNMSLGAQPVPEPVYEKFWEKSPPAEDTIKACFENSRGLGVEAVGWRLSELRCAGPSVSLSWVRDLGMAKAPPGTRVNEDASRATRTVSGPSLSPRGAEELVDPNVVTERYLREEWPGNIARAPDDPPPPPPPGYKGTWNPPPPPWVKRSFTLNVAEFPGQALEIFKGLPGVVVQSIAYAPQGVRGQWRLEGVIYENRK